MAQVQKSVKNEHMYRDTNAHILYIEEQSRFRAIVQYDVGCFGQKVFVNCRVQVCMSLYQIIN